MTITRKKIPVPETANENVGGRRGRPRAESATPQILKAALDLVLREGFRQVTIESIAAKAGVGKATVYRRWPNKAAVMMDAFIESIGPQLIYPETTDARESIRLHMRSLAQVFRGRSGRLLRILLGEIQFDEELRCAFRERWVAPRRSTARAWLLKGIQSGELAPYTDPNVLLDLIYSSIYYTLIIGESDLNDEFVDARWSALFPNKLRQPPAIKSKRY